MSQGNRLTYVTNRKSLVFRFLLNKNRPSGAAAAKCREPAHRWTLRRIDTVKVSRFDPFRYNMGICP